MTTTDDEDDPTDKIPVAGTPALGAKLHQWHGGQGDPLYAVGSCWYAGTTAPLGLVRDAAFNLHRDAAKGARCKTLARTLDRMIAKALKP